ncbi:phosphoribosylglycinamide formyltransferase [Uliginosibacterium gangwonense]|uniref:phosphoribosylglycinamide formyltransferase n=1 Tax=Uliginosibacterium gangwonense TaxID=392736 RepID=UPI00038041C7|nr:phosphoribosylglycinamide formyltransferase [Uliginosibacterium gangwonense]
MKRIVILISGRGSNMEAILEADLPGCQIAAVISNRPDAKGLVFARERGVPALALDHKMFADRAAFDQALAAQIDEYSPDLLVLAGYMRILSDDFVRHYVGRMMNIHPSLLPSFAGLHTHCRALEAGVKVHGATVHFVTPTLDAGPIVIQAIVPVSADDDETRLAAKVLEQEHKIYPQAIRWFVEGRLKVQGNTVTVTGLLEDAVSWSVPSLQN